MGTGETAERPEELINSFLKLLTATANIAAGVGTLALLWSTVVLLGGFVSILLIKEFWLLTALSFLMAFKTVDNYDNEFKRGIYVEEKNIIAFIQRRRRGFGLDGLMFFLRVMLLPKYLLLACFALLAFDILPLLALGISLWRLIRRDYGDTGGDTVNSAKLNGALDIFYALVLFQSFLVIYWVSLDTILMFIVWVVALRTKRRWGDEKWSFKVVDMYRSETRNKLKKDGELPDDWNLITYGVGLLQSSASSSTAGGDDHLWGARVLSKISDDKGAVSVVRQKLLCSRLSIQNLIGMIGRRGTGDDDDMENRERAATIVAHLARDLLITHFPGMPQSICSLLESCNQVTCPSSQNNHSHADEQRRHADPDKEKDPHGSPETVVPIQDQTDGHEHGEHAHAVVVTVQMFKMIKKWPKAIREKRFTYESRGAKEVVSQGLLIVEGLTQDQGNCAEISKIQRLLSKITSPLSSHDFLSYVVRDDTMDMVAMLSKSLTVVSRLLITSNPGDGATRLHRELASNMEAVNNLMGVLGTGSKGAQQLQEPALEILTELAFGNYLKQQDFVKLFNALLNIAIAAEPNNVVAQEPNIAIVQVQHADTERTTILRGKASEALARLIPLRTARGILAKQDAIDLLAKVFGQILSSKMGTGADAARGGAAGNSCAAENAVESQPDPTQGNEKPSEDALGKEKQSDESKFMAAMLSLAVVIIRNRNVIISEEDFARATPDEDAAAALVKKLKEILEANKHISSAECLRVVKLTCQVVIAMIQVKPIFIKHFNEQNFREALTKALETMSEADHCMLFAGNDPEVITPVRSLAFLVKEAQGLMSTAQEH